MIRIGVVTLFPQMIEALASYGITGRAIENGLLRVVTANPRDFSTDKHRVVDDRPYGGGPGMVMMVQPLRAAIRNAKEEIGGKGCRVIYLSPQGRRLDQRFVETLAGCERLVLVAGRYEGIDSRVIETDIDEELSIGDYILSGGELAAMVVIEALTRVLPGALGHPDSAQEDSFTSGLLDFPQYTRPEVIDGQKVPQVLLSGDHQAIRRWRLKQALGATWLKRPDLIDIGSLTEDESALLAEFRKEWTHRSD